MIRAAELLHLFRPPCRGAWTKSAAIAAVAMVAIGAIAAATGLAGWAPQPFSSTNLALVAVMLVIPSFGEEVLFRGVLFPVKGSRYLLASAAISVVLFVMWHPLQSWSGIGPAWSATFLRGDFIACVSVLGISLSAMRMIANSLWPPIIFHWMVVAGWKMLFGGPF